MEKFPTSEILLHATKPLGVICLLVGAFFFALMDRPKDWWKTALPVQPVVKKDYLIALSIAALFYVLAVWRLDQPNQFVFDEIYHGRSGREYVLGLNPHEWTHPPLTKLLIAVSLQLWGATFDPRDGYWQEHGFYPTSDVIGWRFASVVFGTLSLLVLFALARSLSKNRAVATVATLLLALDGVFFVQSRIAMTNIFTVCFILTAALGAYRHVETAGKRWLFVTALGLSGAVSTRWSTLVGLGLIGLYLLWHTVLPLLLAKEKRRFYTVAAQLVWLTLCLLVIPALLYLVAYIPYLRQGHDLAKVFDEQRQMWNYHTLLKEGHPYSSPWWTWPLTLRPTWYAFTQTPAAQTKGILCIGNSLIWWSTIPVLGASAYLAWVYRSRAFQLIALLGLGQWLIWAVQPRSLIFLHYLFEAIPFVCIGLAWIGVLLWREGGFGRFFSGTYALATIAWFVYFYPLLSYYPIPNSEYGNRLWMQKLWVMRSSRSLTSSLFTSPFLPPPCASLAGGGVSEAHGGGKKGEVKRLEVNTGEDKWGKVA